MTSVLVDREDPILREHALDVPLHDIGSKKLETVIKKMQKAMHAEDDGVAIAAPQVGESLRLFVVNGATIDHIRRKLNNEEESEDAEQETPDQIYINPTIIKRSRTKEWLEEGCLSLRWLYGRVERSEKVTIKALDQTGKKIQVGASGLLAQIFQHEIDHLNGVLFTDKAKEIEDIPPEKHDEESN